MGEESHSVMQEEQQQQERAEELNDEREEERDEKKEQDPEEQVEHLEEEIAETRERLGVYLSELDHRRHHAMKLVRRGGAVALGLTALTIAAIVILKRSNSPERSSRDR